MYYGWRGVVGLVKPTYRPGSLEDMIRLMPEGIGVIPAYVGVRSGTEEEFLQALEIAAQRVALLASLGADIIAIEGAPPTMLRGWGFDQELAAQLTAQHGVPVITATLAQVEALRAMAVQRLVGVTYFGDDLNAKFAAYFEGGGFRVVTMAGYPRTAFAEVGKIPPEEIYAFAKQTFLQAGGGDGIYFMGAGWRVLPIIAMLERDLKTTVIASIPAMLRALLARLRVREVIKGYGRLLEELG